MEDGGLVSDEKGSTVKERIDFKDCSDGFVLDGFLEQSIKQLLDSFLDVSQKIEYVLRIKVDEEDIIKRLMKGKV